MTRLPLLALATAALALPGCVINHDLGQTAGEGSSSGGTLGGTTGGSANEDGSSADPSATSGQIPTVSSSITASGDDSGSSITATSDDGSIPTETATATGGNPNCGGDPLFVAWNQDPTDPLLGIPVSFAAVLSGTCQLTDTDEVQAEAVFWTMDLECTLSGRIDGDDSITDQNFSIQIAGDASEPWLDWTQWVEDEPLQLRVVLDWWGMGWNRYLTLGDDAGLLMDFVSAERVDPTTDGSWVKDIEAMLQGEGWHGEFVIDTVDSECNFETGECGEHPQAVTFQSKTDQLQLEQGQNGETIPIVPDRVFTATVLSAIDIPKPMCTDTPSGDYQFSMWTPIP